jgi:hypothetical protein
MSGGLQLMMYGCFTVTFLDAAVYVDSAPCNGWQQYDQALLDGCIMYMCCSVGWWI